MSAVRTSIDAPMPNYWSPEEYEAEHQRRREAADKPERPLIFFQRADQVEVTPVPWLVENWWAEDTLSAIVGPSGTYKTFVAIGVGCCVATGTPWHGCSVKSGAVFILAGEGRNGLRKRIEGWCAHNKRSIAGAPLYLADRLPRLDLVTTVGILDVVDALRQDSGQDPALVIIDTVARALVGDENSSTDMGLLVECADWIRSRFPGCTVLLVHHTGHSDKGRARGSSAFYAALDSEVLMKPLQSGEVQMHATKCKDWAPPRATQYRPESIEITVPGLPAPTSTLVLVDTQLDRSATDSIDVHAMRSSGKTIREIADETGIPKSTVGRLLKDPPAAPPIWEEPV